MARRLGYAWKRLQAKEGHTKHEVKKDAYDVQNVGVFGDFSLLGFLGDLRLRKPYTQKNIKKNRLCLCRWEGL